MKTLLARLARARAGAAAMEMVLITPVVGGLLFGALDFSNAWATRLQLEQAAQRGIEVAIARGVVTSGYQFALSEAQAAWGKPLVSSAVDTWLECDGVRQPPSVLACPGMQRARYVSIRLQAEYVPVFGWGGMISGTTANGGFVVTGDAVVRLQ